MHPSQPDLAFAVAGTAALYRTTDGGGSWSQLLHLEPFFANYGPMQFDPAHPNRIYAIAGDSGLWRSTDGGASFVNISPFTPEGINYAAGLAGFERAVSAAFDALNQEASISIVLPATTRSSSHLTLSSGVNVTLPEARTVATRD
jgi:hypothetical protein